MAPIRRYALFFFLALSIGCALPHPALERPVSPPDAVPEKLLPPGRVTPFAYLGSKAGAWAVMPDGSRMAALCYPSSGQAMRALKVISNRQKRQGSSRRTTTIGDRGYLTYGGANRQGLVWTSGVWLFVAEAPTPEALNRLVADSPAGGQGGQGGPGKSFLVILVGAVFLLMILLWVLLRVIVRWTAVSPQPGISPLSRMELRDRLLALNAPDRPFVVRDGEESDLVAEWKIVDASWWGVFAKAGLKKAYRLLLALDEKNHEVRAIDEEGSIEWQAGAPGVHYSRQRFRGITLFRYERGVGYGLKEGSLEPGKVYDYRFNIREIKGPVVEVVTAAGWRFAPVLWKRQVRGSAFR